VTTPIKRDLLPAAPAARGLGRLSWPRLTRLGPLAARRERWFYLFIAPWLIGFVVFQAGPILAAVVLGFSNYHLTRGIEWAGWQHFRDLAADPIVRRSLVNTAYYTFTSVPLSLLVAFGLAVLLNQKVRGVNLFRTAFFLPSVVQGVAVYMLWGWIFNPRFGLVNNFLKSLSLPQPGWLYDKDWAMPSLILMSLWGIGWMMLIYLAGLQDIPAELYEAAELDGAGSWQRVRYITLPLISPVTFFLFITGVIGAMQVFAPAYVLTRGGPNYATTTITLLIYLAAFQWDRLGFASALALVLFVIILLVTLFQFGVARRWVHYGTEVD
jgi:multiple sugar transport system permease protein